MTRKKPKPILIDSIRRLAPGRTIHQAYHVFIERIHAGFGSDRAAVDFKRELSLADPWDSAAIKRDLKTNWPHLVPLLRKKPAGSPRPN
jgi:hypothetical protein